MLNTNFVEQSDLSSLATRRNCNVCWIDSSKFGKGVLSRNWTKADIGDVYKIAEWCVRMCEPSEVFAWTFSDGVLLGHILAQEPHGWDAVVAHSGLFRGVEIAETGPAVLVVVGMDEPHGAVMRAAVDADEAYREADRKVTLWRVPGLAHNWAVSENDNMLDWCVKA